MKQKSPKAAAKTGIRPSRRPPAPSQMDALLKRCGIHLDAMQLEQLWAYHQLLRQHDADLNLTRIHNFENMVLKLYADSMLPALKTTLPSPLMDLGSGPGMPGIPLKIFRPELTLLLAEGRRQRIDFLQTAVAALGLPGLEVIDRGIAPDFDRPVAGVITRAVEPIADTLARVAGCLAQDGQVIFMKGPHCDAEVAEASQVNADDYALTADIPYQIPHTPHQRRLLCYRRLSAPVRQMSQKPLTAHRVRIIESEANPVFKDLKKLLGGRGVKKIGQTLVCGSRLTAEVLSRQPKRCLAWITNGDRQPLPANAPERMDWLQLAPELYQAIDLFGTRSPIVLYQTPPLAPWRAVDAALPGCSLLIPFQDPENVGAVIRSAAAFDVERVVLLAESANPYHPKAIRASAGTVFSTNLFQGPALESLPHDLPVIALAATGSPLADFAFPPAFCLLPGMEGPGLPSHWQARSVSIPMASGVESLNAAVATAIALYEWRRGRR